jgi:hypothetical protein
VSETRAGTIKTGPRFFRFQLPILAPEICPVVKAGSRTHLTDRTYLIRNSEVVNSARLEGSLEYPKLIFRSFSVHLLLLRYNFRWRSFFFLSKQNLSSIILPSRALVVGDRRHANRRENEIATPRLRTHRSSLSTISVFFFFFLLVKVGFTAWKYGPRSRVQKQFFKRPINSGNRLPVVILNKNYLFVRTPNIYIYMYIFLLRYNLWV